jgi:proteasome lid subunit RPN8/RPN11
MNLTDKLEAEIIAHAKAEDPRECCGLIAVVKGRQRYFPCGNIAITSDEHFILDPKDYAAAEDAGEIIAVVHSHPDVPPKPSGADQVSCNATGLPWIIVNPRTEQWGGCSPKNFEPPYVGREFAFGVMDCYALARDWYRCELGVILEDVPRRDLFWERGDDVCGKALQKQLACLRQMPFAEMQYGDLLFFNIESKLCNHVAVYLGDQQILQHHEKRLSSRDVLDGYYVKALAMVTRHESR